MGYLFDSDALITPNNTWYTTEFCPAYWELLLRANANGEALSIEKVFEEVQRVDDEVASWAVTNKHFFEPLDLATTENYKTVAEYIYGLRQPIEEAAKTEFLRGADPLLVAYALTHNHTVVTCENEVGNGCKTVKLPNVCKHFGVRSISPMLVPRELGACFKLKIDKE